MNMGQINVAVGNLSDGRVTDDQLRAAIGALQKQVDRDFAPVWGIEARLHFVPQGERAPADYWWLIVFDTSDRASALGYHDLTKSGMPFSKVFAGTAEEKGLPWSVSASHELLEMLVDPELTRAVIEPQERGVEIYALEVCDPCRSPANGYSIDRVKVSDFVFPDWFKRDTGGVTPGSLDKTGRIKRPRQLLVGGYIAKFDAEHGTGWYVQMATGRPGPGVRAKVGSREEKRLLPRTRWMRSADVVPWP